MKDEHKKKISTALKAYHACARKHSCGKKAKAEKNIKMSVVAKPAKAGEAVAKVRRVEKAENVPSKGSRAGRAIAEKVNTMRSIQAPKKRRPVAKAVPVASGMGGGARPRKTLPSFGPNIDTIKSGIRRFKSAPRLRDWYESYIDNEGEAGDVARLAGKPYLPQTIFGRYNRTKSGRNAPKAVEIKRDIYALVDKGPRGERWDSYSNSEQDSAIEEIEKSLIRLVGNLEGAAADGKATGKAKREETTADYNRWGGKKRGTRKEWKAAIRKWELEGLQEAHRLKGTIF